MSWAQCSVCLETFGSDSGFDKHRVRIPAPEYDWRCATEAEMLGRGWHRDQRGWWRLPDSRFAGSIRTRSDATRESGAGDEGRESA